MRLFSLLAALVALTTACASPACQAARRGDAGALAHELDAGRAKADDGLLYCAVEKGQTSTTKVLLERGAKPRQWTLWKAEKHPEVLALLQPATAAPLAQTIPTGPAQTCPQNALCLGPNECPGGVKLFDAAHLDDYRKALSANGGDSRCMYVIDRSTEKH